MTDSPSRHILLAGGTSPVPGLAARSAAGNWRVVAMTGGMKITIGESYRS